MDVLNVNKYQNGLKNEHLLLRNFKKKKKVLHYSNSEKIKSKICQSTLDDVAERF